ncbi:hypothetical protein BpHYR1_018841 [Brachionus plicatilis]|uniref:Uncharacterized protein n=1 Tax=Brachionus plicatilis TaxID=10195 RepID=A0A3M7QRS8_BRAPC|nr:hypothetical protein BpHYR1_018841 [Brachionus plicatilis]
MPTPFLLENSFGYGVSLDLKKLWSAVTFEWKSKFIRSLTNHYGGFKGHGRIKRNYYKKDNLYNIDKN